MATVDQQLVNTWVTGWAHSNDKQLQMDGSVPIVDRAVGAGREVFLFEPDAQTLSHYAQALNDDGAGTIIVVTRDLASIYPLAGEHQLYVRNTEESLMVQDTEIQDVEAPPMPWDEFNKSVERHDGAAKVLVHHGDKEIARGQVAVVGNTAVYDRVETSSDYRRKGLGSFVMRSLTAVALENDIDSGLIIATADGRLLYSYLGWSSIAAVANLGPGSER